MAVIPLVKNLVTLVEATPRETQGGISLVEPDADDGPGGLSGSEENPDGSVTMTFGKENKAPASGPDDKFNRNLAEGMDDFDLNALTSTLLQGIDSDEQSRREWEDTANVVAAYLGVKLEDPASSVGADGTVCKAVATCLLESAIKLWGTSRAELLPVTGPVKTRRDAAPPPSAQEEAEAATGAPQPGAGAATPGGDEVGIGGVSAQAGEGGGEPDQTGIAGIGHNGGPTALDGDFLAAALENDMNHYLTVLDRGYYADFSKMLMSRNLIGMAFRKVYRDPLLRRPISRWVKAQNLIVSNEASHLDDAGRITERVKIRQATMKRLQVAGHYRDIDLVHPTGKTSATELAVAASEGISAISQLPADHEHTVYETYVELGEKDGPLASLGRDETGKTPGYPLPYRVSIDDDSQAILEIRRNWKKGDEDHRARRHYVKYGFLPAFGFYDWGLIHVVGNPTQAATMIQRATVDSTLFANFPGGVYLRGPGSRQANTVVRPNPGEYVAMDAAGAQRIQDVMMPLPYKPPSPEALELLQKFETDVRRIAGVVEVPVGEGRLGNTPVGTIMSYIESVSQVPGAVHKDDHITQQDEFLLLRELFAEEPETLVRGAKKPARKWQVAEEVMAPDMVPSADPNTPSEVHRLLKIQAAIALSGLPQYAGIANHRAIYMWAMENVTGDKAEEFTNPPQAMPPAPPDPRIQAAQIKAQTETEKMQAQAQTEQQKHGERMQELASEDQQRDQDRQSAETRAAMSLEAARVKATTEASTAHMEQQHTTANAHADRQHEAGQSQADRAQLDAHKSADLQQTDQHKQMDVQQQQMAGAQQAAEGQATRDQADDHHTADLEQAASEPKPKGSST